MLNITSKKISYFIELLSKDTFRRSLLSSVRMLCFRRTQERFLTRLTSRVARSLYTLQLSCTRNHLSA